jgi:cell division protein FtsB
MKARKRRLLGVALVLLLALCGIVLAHHLAPYWNNHQSDESIEDSDEE